MNLKLGLEQQVYLIIVHGILTMLNLVSRANIHDFIGEQHGVLDMATEMV